MVRNNWLLSDNQWEYDSADAKAAMMKKIKTLSRDFAVSIAGSGRTT